MNRAFSRLLFRALPIAIAALMPPWTPARAQAPAANAAPRATPPSAQPTSVSLEQALRLAEQSSEAIAIARTGVKRAEGETYRARSQALPQISGSLGYTRTLRSQFQDFGGGGTDTTTAEPPPPPGPCDQYLRDPSASVADRLQGLEDANRCALGVNPFSGFDQVGFGAKNQYNLGLNLSQPLFTGGRIAGTNQIAAAGKRTADIELATQRAQLQLDVTEAYFDAALGDRLVQIAESSLVQTEAVFRQVQLARQVGNQSEFDLLRAQVARDNLRPVLIQRRTDRELAYLRLKQLLELPGQAALQLTTSIQDAAAAAPQVVSGAQSDTSAGARAPVRQAAEAVEVQRGLVRIQRSERFPSVSLTSQYGRVAFPSGGFPAWGDFRTNWTVGIGLQLPLFTGGRMRGDEIVAQANLSEAQLRLEQVSEVASLDARAAMAQLEQAQAAWEASAGTAEQATRAHTIAQVRYEEGLSTQVELSDARLLLQQAQTNRALAARDLQVARMRVALLRDLPIGGQQGSGAAQQQFQQQLQMQQQQQQQRNAQPTAPATGGFPGQPGGGSDVP